MTRLSHIDDSGEAAMVDVSAKDVTERFAEAEGSVVMRAETFRMMIEGNAKKGDVLGVARIAGLMAAKKTHDLIPLCHPLQLSAIRVDLEPAPDLPGVRVRASAKVVAKTGVEMEALTAVSVACLTVYDMLKAVDRFMRIENIGLVHKSGGASGPWRRGDDA